MRSLRGRVTLAATAAVALVLAVVGVLIVASYARHERSSLDDSLSTRAADLVPRASRLAARQVLGVPGRGGIGPLEPAGPPSLAVGSGSFIRVLAGGQVVISAGDVPGSGFPEPSGTGFRTVNFEGLHWRTYTRQLPLPGGRLQLADDLSPVESRISDIRLRVVVIAAIGVLLAGVAVHLLGALALEPLGRLRRAVAGVSGTRDLSRRVPAGDGPVEVDDLAEDVNAMLGRLERALEAQRRFAADVGHELRTPLTSIRANLDALARSDSMPEAERRQLLAEVRAEQSRVVALLDALQMLARGDAGAALPVSEVDLAETVDAAVVAARRRHPGVRFELDAPAGPVPLRGWPDGLRLVVDNLLENAARHGRPDGTVAVRVARDTDAWLLDVDDDGPGVPYAERERVFERFARGQDAHAPGSGLGLALVAQQAELHGGDVRVADSPAGGARFTVRLSGG